MAKFDSHKWIYNNKYSRLNEQATGSATGSYITCYACINGSVQTNSNTYTSSLSWTNHTNICGYVQTGNQLTTWYTDNTTSAITGCTTGSAATGSGKYRIDAGGCLECPPQYANHPACIYTEPTCGQGGSTSSTGSATPPTPQSGTSDSQIEDSCKNWGTVLYPSKKEQKDF